MGLLKLRQLDDILITLKVIFHACNTLIQLLLNPHTNDIAISEEEGVLSEVHCRHIDQSRLLLTFAVFFLDLLFAVDLLVGELMRDVFYKFDVLAFMKTIDLSAFFL